MIRLWSVGVVLLAGCAVKPIVVKTRQVDSVFVREQIRDTVVRLEADQAVVQALVECDSLGKAHIRELLHYKAGTRTPPPVVSIKENVLTSRVTIDSVDLCLQLKDRYEKTVSEGVVTEIIEVNRLTFWQKMWMRVGQLLSGIFGVILLLKYRR